MTSLRVLIDENLVELSNAKSLLFKKNLIHKLITGIRGEGLFLAIQLADKECVKYLIANAPRYGLILDYFLFCEDAFR